MLPRLLRIVNFSLAFLLLVAAISVYWYAVRPLPKTSGLLEAPVSHPATVRRDARGIPHIEASSWQDAIFLQGFVTAQDRLWQMDTLRRFAAGELSEVFGPVALGADQEARRMRIRAIAESQLSGLRPQDRAVMVEYARGVNYFIHTNRDKLPLEFSLPGHSYNPRDWELTDTLLVGLVMFRDLTDSAKFELAKFNFFAQANDQAKARFLFPAMEGQYVSPGSNAWAVSGAHTASGKPMLANDPHLAFGIPPTWFLVHLKAPGLNVSGASLPGVPCVISGHNEQIAWGVTNVQADVMDLYAESLDDRSGRYLYKGVVEQAQLDHQLIGVKDQKPAVLDTWITRHGPVLFKLGDKSYSMRWSANGAFVLPFFDIDRASDWNEFRAALRDFLGPGQNFVYADRAGNIGYQVTGKLPIRRGFDGDLPLDGASGKFEWDGFIPFDELPSFYNPASGIVATANQNPFPAGYPYRVGGSFHDRYRIEQIRTRLGAKKGLDVTDMLAVQKDVYSGYDYFLARQVVATAARLPTPTDKLTSEALDVLNRWNGQMDKDASAPVITQLLSTQLATSLLNSLTSSTASRPEPSAAPDKTGGGPARTSSAPVRPPVSSAGPAILPRPEVVERLLRTRPAGWVPGNDWDHWLMQCLSVALADGRARQGTPVSAWQWGRIMRWKLAHPIGKELPVVNAYFDIGPVPMSGSGSTVKQTTATLGPSERMVANTADWDKSVQNLTTGESGHVASRHYRDEWPAYYIGTSFPMEFNRIDARDVLTVRPSAR